VNKGVTLTKRQRKVAAWARERMANPATLFLDTETTGTGAEAEIIELAVIDLNGNALIDTLVAPVEPIPPESTRIHGLVDADVIGAPSWSDVYPLLAPLLRERPVVVYNAEFDRRMIARCCVASGLKVEHGEWHCAMRSYANWAGVRSSPHRRRFRLHKLRDALAAFDLPGGNHRALGDALACRNLVKALADEELGARS
jgi:DNA polymerase-3 subunit epsilon